MIYIIDYENRANQFLQSDRLKFKKGDKVYICWENTKSSHLDGGLILDWQEKGVQFEKLIVYGGRSSATDMQFSSFAGYLFGQEEGTEMIIVSNDLALKGLEPFWKDRGKKLTVVNLDDKKPNQTPAKKQVKFSPEQRQQIHHQLQLDQQIDKKHIPDLMKIIKKVEDKTALQEACQATFSGKKGTLYYQVVSKIAGI
jgi:hypothetical protein